ncbi:MAG: DUF1684 domain-containing protein [Anaerolineales bacterium]|nr:DUF1684 domain-containing protein [Anaerolineales bacterium]
MNMDIWKEQIEAERMEKDAFFGRHPQSPIPPAERAGFRGLDYYPPDPGMRFELELSEHTEKKAVRMAYSKGAERDYIRWGEFRFVVDGKECTLQAYKSNADEDRLFVPFRDETSGKETYGAGRYLDLHAAMDRTADGKWVLDLNHAYNPWCVYSEDFTCPIVPLENRLAVPIRAGEKNYGNK